MIGAHVALSLAAFIVVYTVLFGTATYYILKLIGKGIDTQAEGFEEHSQIATPFKDPTEKGA